MDRELDKNKRKTEAMLRQNQKRIMSRLYQKKLIEKRGEQERLVRRQMNMSYSKDGEFEETSSPPRSRQAIHRANASADAGQLPTSFSIIQGPQAAPTKSRGLEILKKVHDQLVNERKMKNRDKAFTEAIRRKIEQRPSPSRSPLGLAPMQPDLGNEDYGGTTMLR